MSYFRNEFGAVFYYDDEQVSQGYGSDMEPMTPQEVQEHINPRPTFQKALARLNEVYQADLQKLNASYSMAILVDGTSEAAKVANIRAQYAARKDLHTANVAALKLEYGV